MAEPIIKGFIFDFDGTIIVSEDVHMRAWEDLSRQTSLKLPHGFLEMSVGMADHQLVRILFEAWHHELSEMEILNKKKNFYMARVPSECHPVPGVVDVIHRLKDKSFPLAIATSSSREEVAPILKNLNLSGHFSDVITVDDVRSPKPDPEIYRLAASKLGLPPKVCMAFEDSRAGVASARAAGCILVTVQTLYDEKTLGPALRSIRDFTDPDLRIFLDKIAP